MRTRKYTFKNESRVLRRTSGKGAIGFGVENDETGRPQDTAGGIVPEMDVKLKMSPDAAQGTRSRANMTAGP